jgi:hypothetical protein
MPRSILFADVTVILEADESTAYTRVGKQESQLYSYMYLSIKEESSSAC